MTIVKGLFFSAFVFLATASAQQKEFDIFSSSYQGYPLFFQAVESGADGHLDQAEASFRQVLLLLPHHLEARLNFGICRDLNEGILDKKTAIKLFRIQKDFYNFEDQWQLEKQISRVSERNSKYDRVFILKGNMYFKWKEDSLALQAFDRAISANPESALGYFYRGRTQARMNRAQQAIADFSASLSHEPDLSQALYQRGVLYSENRDFDASLQDFERAMRISNNNLYHFKIYETYNNRGIGRLQRKEYRAAKNDFDRAIGLDQRFGEVYMNRAMANRGLGKYDSALADMNTAEALDSGSAELHFYRGEVLLHLGREDEAIKELEKAVILNDGDSRYHYALAEIFIDRMQFDKAIPHLEKTTRINPDKEWAFYQLAFCFDNLKNYRQAVIYYEAFLDKASTEHFRHITHVKNRIRLLRSYLKAVRP